MNNNTIVHRHLYVSVHCLWFIVVWFNRRIVRSYFSSQFQLLSRQGWHKTWSLKELIGLWCLKPEENNNANMVHSLCSLFQTHSWVQYIRWHFPQSGPGLWPHLLALAVLWDDVILTFNTDHFIMMGDSHIFKFVGK